MFKLSDTSKIPESISHYGIGIFSIVPDDVKEFHTMIPTIRASKGVEIKRDNTVITITVPAGITADLEIAKDGILPSRSFIKVIIKNNARATLITRYKPKAPCMHAEEYELEENASLNVERFIDTNTFLRITHTANLSGNRALYSMNGSNRLTGSNTCDITDIVMHKAICNESVVAVKSMVSDTSKLIWRGITRVPEDAKQSKVKQYAKTLLMNEDAEADTVPILELFAHDVRAHHASAITTIDPEQVFYLTSRGINKKEAIACIVEGFLQIRKLI